MEKETNVLLVEDNPKDAAHIKSILAEINLPEKSLFMASSLRGAITHEVSKKKITLILLDLSLPDCDGINAVKSIRNFFPDNTLVIITNARDENTAIAALREGAQDYLIKGTCNAGDMQRVIRFATERQLNVAKLNSANDANIKADVKILQMHEQLRNLSSYLQNIRENERTTIAREIHDELGQQLTGLKIDISWLKKRFLNDLPASEKVKDILSLIDGTIKSVRRISTELRPEILDDKGLIAAIDWQNVEFGKRVGINCRFENRVEELPFHKNIATGIFRIFQETLTNIARHAEANEIVTTFYRENQNLVLTVNDDGKGFDEFEVSEKKTLGLIGMKERAFMMGGKLYINSVKDKGTTSILVVPLMTEHRAKVMSL